MSNKLKLTIKDIGVPQQQAKTLLDNFGGFFVEAHKLTAKSKAIEVTSEDQTAEMQEAREYRLQLRDIRVEADKTRKALKEGYLRGGRAVQRIFNDIKKITKSEENRLLKQEKFAEVMEAERKNKIHNKRIEKLSKYVEDVGVYTLHPDEMSTETFDKLLETSKKAFEAQKEAEKKAEEERIAKEKAEREEQERIRKENAKLKKEAEAREKKIAKEKAEQAAKLKKEREAREKLELEAKKKREAEEAKIKAEKEAEAKARAEVEEKARQALLAPDKEKLLNLAQEIELIQYPALKSKQAQDVCDVTINKLIKAVEELREGIKTL